MNTKRYLTRNQIIRNFNTNFTKRRGINEFKTNGKKLNPPHMLFLLTVIIGGAMTIHYRTPINLDIQKNATIEADDVKNHNSIEKGLWVSINGYVYDLTKFSEIHPGGAQVLQKYGGYDASYLFNKIHPKDVIEKMLPKEACLGSLVGELDEPNDPILLDEKRSEGKKSKRPSLSTILNSGDFEFVSKAILPAHAWAYYSGGSDDEVTMRENHSAYNNIFFKPKVCVSIDSVDISTEFFGSKTEAPFYCSATASAKLGHPDGELSIARGCGKEGIIQMISSAASYTLDEITEAASSCQSQWFQLYAKKNRSESLNDIKKCEEKGIKAIFVTVDTPQFGRREKDLRFKLSDNPDIEALELSMKDKNDFILSYNNVNLTWTDIKLFKEATSLPIVVKGVQRVEDILIAIENGVDGVVLSNHGGRQLDFSRAPLEVLAEAMPVLRAKNLDKKVDIFIDGGVRRGSDVIKALCLGAKGVGLGRPFLYANSAYGENGVRKLCMILKDEIERDMKLLGVSTLDELSPELLEVRKNSNMNNYSSGMIYEPLYDPKFKD